MFSTSIYNLLVSQIFSWHYWTGNRSCGFALHLILTLTVVLSVCFSPQLDGIGIEVRQILPHGLIRRHRHSDSTGSTNSSRSNPIREDKTARSNSHRARSQLLESHLAKLFEQKMEIFTKVEYTQVWLSTLFFKASYVWKFNAWLYSVAICFIRVDGSTDLIIDMKAWLLFLRAFCDDFSGVNYINHSKTLLEKLARICSTADI